ncbi:hypothetical protein CPB84DRAFT_1848087 [Gymnopilus junonius]|uniref:JmjC domain-containing protein n=1 Tax=Gymnopilus junonius TaxID=109634 RepID=A0A9P5TMW1_GYMJU|nr:hypothetical protein CPB84DRAFT_1848087 [Gymnopilus junonius]
MLAAATYLSYLKEFCNTDNKFLDLPDQINDDVLKHASSEEERAFLRELHEFMEPMTSSHHHTNPIYLASPSVLPKKSWGKATLVQTSQHLGNDKPKELLDVERIFWQILFGLVDGSFEPQALLPTLGSRLPWSIIELAAESLDNGSWFDLLNSIPITDSVNEDDGTFVSMDFALPISGLGVSDLFNYRNAKIPSNSNAVTSASVAPVTSSDSPVHPLPSIDECAVNEPEPSPEAATSLEDVTIDGAPAVDGVMGNDLDICVEPDGVSQAMSVDPAPVEPLPSVTPDDAVGSAPIEPDTSSMSVDPTPVETSPTTTLDGAKESTPVQVNTSSTAPSSEPLSSTQQANITNSAGLSTKVKTLELSKATPAPGKKGISGSLSAAKKRKKKLHPSPSGGNSIPTPPPASLAAVIISRKRKPSVAGSKANPIDVDLINTLPPWEPDNLRAFHIARQEEESVQVQSGTGTSAPSYEQFRATKEYTVFNRSGNKVTLQPQFHFEDYLQRFDEILTGMKSSNINDCPLFMEKPEASIIHVLMYEEYSSLSTSQLHEYLSKQNIVGLSQLGKEAKHHSRSPKKSCWNGDFDDFDCQMKHIPLTITGTLRLLFDQVNAGDKGRTLNGLDLPLPHQSMTPMAYSTDRHAFHHTRGRLGFPSSKTFPTTNLCWALAGAPDTITFLHINSDGFNTHVLVICGGKTWIFYRQSSDTPLSSRHTFFHLGFHLDHYIPPTKYGLEAIYLSKGNLLLMRANQPHAVYGKEATIIHGGHFYLSSMMEVTVQSLIHTFILDQFLSNTTYHQSHLLLHRIIDFYRMGLLEEQYVDPGTCETTSASMRDILWFGNILDFHTYSAPNQSAEEPATPAQKYLMMQYDCNDIPKTYCVITSLAGEVIQDLPAEYLCRQVSALLSYKKAAMKEGKVKGAPHCTVKLLKCQVDNALASDAHILDYWTTKHSEVDDSELGFGSQVGYSLRWREGKPVLRTYEELLKDGTTALDHVYLEGEAYHFQQDEEFVSGRPSPIVPEFPGIRIPSLHRARSSSHSSLSSLTDVSDLEMDGMTQCRDQVDIEHGEDRGHGDSNKDDEDDSDEDDDDEDNEDYQSPRKRLHSS